MKTFTLPYPPTVNTYWRNVGGRVLVSKKGRQYRLDVQAAVLGNWQGRATGRLGVVIKLHPPDRRKRDLDNTLKAVLDSLARAGVYHDDSQIDDLRIIRMEPERNGSAIITITNLKGKR